MNNLKEMTQNKLTQNKNVKLGLVKLGLNINCNISRTVYSLGLKFCTPCNLYKRLKCKKLEKKYEGVVV